MPRVLPAIAILTIGVLLVISGCGGGSDSGSSGEAGGNGAGGTRTASVDGVISPTGNIELGEILVNDLGLTLYVFQEDKGDKSACYGACAETWPPITTSGAGQISGVTDDQAALLGKTTRKGGTLQVTFAGHPLYTYADDEAGEANGQGIDSFGGEWYALRPSGEEVGD